MPDQLADWFPPAFADTVHSRLPAPKSRATGKPMWEGGMRLSPEQRRILVSRSRYKKVDGGIRGGKSFIAGDAIYLDFIWRTMHSKVVDDLWGIVADSYKMAEEEMRHIDRLLNESNVPHDFHTPINQSWSINFPHFPAATIITLTGSDVAKVASRPYRGLVIAEAAQTSYELLLNCRERVSETRGWVMLEGTFENQKGAWYAMLSREWERPDAMGEVFQLPSWANLAVFPGGRQDPEILAMEREMGPVRFMERCGGIPMKSSKVVFPQAVEEFLVKHRFPRLGHSYDPERPVYLCIDPGITHAYAVLAFQVYAATEQLPQTPPGYSRLVGPNVPAANIMWFFDAIFRWGRGAEQMIAETAARPWAGNVQEAVMDFAGRQQRSEGASNLEQWQKGWLRIAGRPLPVHANPVPLQAGYDLHKAALLNSWPEDRAQLIWNPDKRLLARVTDPNGMRIMFDPAAAAPLFGGMVDGMKFEGEYNLHVNRRNTDEPLDTFNDAIKAISYGVYWYFSIGGQKHKSYGINSVPWELVG